MKLGVLEDIVDCGLGRRTGCKWDGVKPHSHELSPKAEAHKANEMTVLRALQLIDAFDLLDREQDWTDVPGATYRKILGNRYEYGTLLSECWTRYKRGTLYREVLDLYQNLAPEAQNREEIREGIESIREAEAGRGATRGGNQRAR